MRGADGGGDLTACRWSGEAEELDVVGAAVDGREGGADEEAGTEDAPLEEVISPAAAESLFVKDEMAQPAQPAAASAWGVPILGFPEIALSGGRAVSGMLSTAFLILWTYTSSVLTAWSRISFSLSMSDGQMAGRTRVAQSSSEKCSDVTDRAIRAAFRA